MPRDFHRKPLAAAVDELHWSVVAFARTFRPPNKASLAVGHIKRAVQSGGEMTLESGLALERELQQRLFESADAREGIAAFVEKRKPELRGR